MKIIKIEKGHTTLQLPDPEAMDYLEDIADEQMIFSPEGIIEDPKQIEADTVFVTNKVSHGC